MKKMIELYFDGASAGNPGHGAYGFVITEDDRTLEEESGYVGDDVTNNKAEYTALVRGLESVKEHHPEKEVKIYGDSQLIIRQMTGEYKVRSENLRPLWKKATGIADELSTDYSWIPREKNEEADGLASEELDSKG